MTQKRQKLRVDLYSIKVVNTIGTRQRGGNKKKLNDTFIVRKENPVFNFIIDIVIDTDQMNKEKD